MHLRTLPPLGSVVARPCPDSGVDWIVRLSSSIAVGCALPPVNSRSSRRKSSTIVSKQCDSIQRCVCW